MTNSAREAGQARGADPALQLCLYMQLGCLLTGAEIDLLLEAMTGADGQAGSPAKLQAAIDQAVALAVARMSAATPSPRRPRLVERKPVRRVSPRAAQKICARP